tara:strand:+ start:224364 stop:225014 length:651 start_codon:yes stop_codon:yes gene_type:complete
MNAQKFQIRYSPVQDRVLIIVTGENAQERFFGLTRRIVKRLVPGLRGIMGDEIFAGLTPTMPFDPPASSTEPDQAEKPDGSAQASAEPAGTAGGATLSGDGQAGPTADGEAATQPDGTPAPPQPDTHLVTRLRIVEKQKGTHVLQISDAATTLNVPLNKDQIIQFTQGILTVLERSEWALTWNDERGEPQPETVPAEADPPAAIDITADSPSRYRH